MDELPTVSGPGSPDVRVTRPGTQIGRYVVIEHIGTGGMGAVYAAYDSQLGRRVAVKVLRASVQGSTGHARLLREAQVMARLAHPNVLTVYDVGAYGDDVFIATEYIEGQTLKAWIGQPHPWREVLGVLEAAGRGLAAAHAAGIIHRDFKLENVLLGMDGRVIVADFGIARAVAPSEPLVERPVPSSARSMAIAPSVSPPAEAPSSPTVPPSASSGPSLSDPLTETGTWIGTVGYMAPERAFDFQDDARSDQFSFAVTLYRALYRQSPFEHTNLSSYLTALLSPPRPPPAGTPVPTWVHAVIARGLEREPADRFPSMADLLAALGRDPTRRRRRWALAAAAVGLAATAAFGWEHQRRVVREECAAGEHLIAETWNPGAREAIGTAIRATNIPLADDAAARTQRVLDDWATAWTRAHREASEATRLRGVESAATMNVRLACLERERGEMGALVDRLAHADKAVATRAINAAYQLPRPQMCWEPNAARSSAVPEAPGPRARVLALQRQVAEASVESATGGCDAVIPAATKGIEEARAIPHRESEAELLLIRSRCERQRGDSDAAAATGEEAFAAALAAGDDSLAALIAARVAFELGNNLARFREAERWLAIGRGVLEREGKDDRAEAELFEAEVLILSAEGYAERTLPLHDRAIALFTRVYGPTDARVASALANQANDLSSLGRQEEAIALLRRGIEIQETLFGPQNPMLYVDYNNMGFAYMVFGRYEQARQAIEHSLSLVKAVGEMSANAIVPWLTMAQLDNRAGRPDSALDDVARAMAIVQATGDNGARYFPCLYVERGMAVLAKGDAAAARDACARSLKLEEEQDVIGPDKVYTDDALTCLGEADLALGKVDEAIEHLERGVTLKKRDSPQALPLAEFALARALRAGGRDPKRARSLAETALGELRAAPGVETQRHALETWLAADERR